MTEVTTTQLTPEWFEVRKQVQLTASKFGEALGVGKGRPYDFFLSLLSDEPPEQSNALMQHGVAMEPVINEAYQLLTGNKVLPTGFWKPEKDSALDGLCGASPDGKIMEEYNPTKVVGFVEYKAPVYLIYTKERFPPHGIPRYYMAQIQGQLGIAGIPWCDFMAVCTKTREIMLHRVYAQSTYWKHLSLKLADFCLTLKDAKLNKMQGRPIDTIEGVQRLKSQPMMKDLLPGEADIVVENKLEVDAHNQYKSTAGHWLEYDFLMGNPVSDSMRLPDQKYQHLLRKLDIAIGLRWC
ncbi:uncharacterized protein [Amphiura filiformis]|uniref:uncharacterized protein n=1 Tax=Amphiura filiformis TaxID=82378 RepID=UPI003B2123C5